MKLTKRQFFKMSIVALAIGLSVLTNGEPTLSKHHVGLVEDWSSHHLIFSNPGSYEQAIANGTYSKWINLRYNNRFIMQQARRRAEALSRSGFSGLTPEGITLVGNPPVLGGMGGTGDQGFPTRGGGPPKRPTKGLQRDWSAELLTGAVLPNTFPAKYSFNTAGTPDCTNDFVVYPTGSSGSSTAATIIAYNELYGTTGSPGTGCGATTGVTVPSVYWAYNTGAGAVTTSPTISLDGTQVAFVQSTSTGAELVVLKWAASGGSVGSPTGLTSTSGYPSCSAPCMVALPFSGSPNDTYSSPFYDYATDDALYVGDDSGKLHKFSPVFNGTPKELVGADYPATLNSGPYAISSPVYESLSGCVLVGDTYGYFYSVNSGSPEASVCSGTPGAINGSTVDLANSALGGIFDAPLVDATTGATYVFVAASAGIGNCAAGSNCVYRIPYAFSGTLTAPYNEYPLGTGGANYNLYAGAFDNVYYSYSASSPSGNLYVVGNTGATSGATLYRVPITSNEMETAPLEAVAGLNSSYPPWPSPVTEFCNNSGSACTSDGTTTTSGTDYIFFSVYSGAKGGCTASAGNGCILDYNVTVPSSPSLAGSMNITAPGNPGCFGTGGFIIDNSSTSTGASQVYFLNLDGNSPAATPSTCTSSTGDTIDAVQASQSALQ